METLITKDGQKVLVSHEQRIQAGDHFVLNNPDHTSSLKNVIKTCFRSSPFFIEPEDQNLVLRRYPAHWCKKIIKYL